MSRRAIGEPLFRILAPLLGVLFVLAALEVGLRLAGYDPIRRYMKVRDGFLRESANPDLDYELVPGSQGFAWGTQVAVNSHGFRDREYPIEKAAGTRRIVVIGDSIAFGTFLELEQTFPRRLEARFAGVRAPVEELNLAIAGSPTIPRRSPGSAAWSRAWRRSGTTLPRVSWRGTPPRRRSEGSATPSIASGVCRWSTASRSRW